MQLQVGVKVLLRNLEGKVLLLRSRDGYATSKPLWDIPGGRIDPGTSLRENLARELLEETGLTLAGHPRLTAAQDILPGDDRHIVRLTYVASGEGTPVLDGVEHTEYRWISFNDLLALADLDNYLSELLASGQLTEDSWAV